MSPAMVLMEPGWSPDRPRPPGICAAELLVTVTPPFPKPSPSPRPRPEAATAMLGPTEETCGWEFGVTGAGVLELGWDVVLKMGSVGLLNNWFLM